MACIDVRAPVAEASFRTEFRAGALNSRRPASATHRCRFGASLGLPRGSPWNRSVLLQLQDRNHLDDRGRSAHANVMPCHRKLAFNDRRASRFLPRAAASSGSDFPGEAYCGNDTPCRPIPPANCFAPASLSPEAKVAMPRRCSLSTAASQPSPHCSIAESRSLRMQL